MRGLYAVLSLGLVLAAAPVSAQQQWTPVAALTAADSAALGAARGTESARHESTTRWVVGGFVGGATLGPIGAGLSWFLANNSQVGFPLEQKVALLSDAGVTYAHAYETSYAHSLRERRKRSALVGGALGTAALAAVATTVWALYYYY